MKRCWIVVAAALVGCGGAKEEPKTADIPEAPAATGSAAPSAEASSAPVETANPDRLALGRAKFEKVCAACHKADGSGQIGPSLSDATWTHGGTPADIAAIIKKGNPSKGMPGFGTLLSEEEQAAVTAYVVSLTPAK